MKTTKPFKVVKTRVLRVGLLDKDHRLFRFGRTWTMWTIVDRDSTEISMSFDLREDAVDVARFMNDAYALGYEDATIARKANR